MSPANHTPYNRGCRPVAHAATIHGEATLPHCAAHSIPSPHPEAATGYRDPSLRIAPADHPWPIASRDAELM
jgi:hypothetical protein